MKTIADHRRLYAEHVVQLAGVSDARLIEAFATVPREDYVGPGPWLIADSEGYMPTGSDDPRALYQDVLVALAPERGINNGQPSLHARCLAEAAAQPGEKVVHVGAGTGYYTAILATLVGPRGRVIALERESDLAARARANLRGFAQVEVRAVSATEGELPRCDVIYVSAGVTHLPAPWLDALNIGGRMVMPLTPNDGWGVMLKLHRLSESGYAARAFSRVSFIPCIGARDDTAAASLSAALACQSLTAVRSLRRTGPPDETAWCAGDGWWLSTAAP